MIWRRRKRHQDIGRAIQTAEHEAAIRRILDDDRRRTIRGRARWADEPTEIQPFVTRAQRWRAGGR